MHDSDEQVMLSLYDSVCHDRNKLHDLLHDLVAALDKCSDEINSAFILKYVRSGVKYTGPTYNKELDAAREYLKNGH